MKTRLIHALEEEGVFLRGMPILRRIELARDKGSNVTSGAPSAASVERINKWRERADKYGTSSFVKILAAYGLDEFALTLLAEDPPRCLRSWSVQELLPRLTEAEEGPPSWEHNSSFAQVCDPLIDPYLHRFMSAVIRKCRDHPGILGNDPEHVFKLFIPALEGRLHRLVRKAAILELNVARLRGKLDGGTPEQRFDSFSKKLAEESFQYEFLAEYSAIAYHALVAARQWLDNSLSFLSRLCGDHGLYIDELFDGRHPGVLESISWAAGDTHRGGQSVCILGWSNGRKLVYKPRSLCPDVAFGKLLDFFNSLPGDHKLKYSKVVDRGSHGWAEFIPHEPCTDAEQVRRFFRRQGEFITLFYLLSTNDLHYENLIASGEFPIYVDCETLVSPPWLLAGDRQYSLDLSPPLASAVDMLPRRVWGKGKHEGVDISGLGGSPGQVLKDAILEADAPGTDKMRVVMGDMVTDAVSHLPHRDGAPLAAASYTDEILWGFENAYTKINQNIQAFSDAIGALKGVNLRLVRRPTLLYDQILDTAAHPDYLRDAVERDSFISSSLAAGAGWGVRQLSAELRDMSEGDIPYFATQFDSRCITDSRQAVVDKLDIGPEDTVSRNLAHVSPLDLRQQMTMLRARLGSLPSSASDSAFSLSRATGFIESPLQNESSESHAGLHRRIVQLILGTAIRTEGRRLWAIPELPAPNDPTLTFSVDIGNLYGGAAGIGLYFMKLHSTTRLLRYRLLFENIVTSVLDWCNATAETPQNCGMFEGRSGIGLFLMAAGRHLSDDRLVEEGRQELLRASSEVTLSEKWDVMTGIAGHLFALIDARDLMEGPELVRAIEVAGEELLKRSVAVGEGIAWNDLALSEDLPLAGFAHGAGGVGAALALAGVIAGREDFIDASWRAVEYENTQFLPAERNWRDNRTVGRLLRQDTEPSLNAWCHGAMGIGLARTYMLSAVRNSREESLIIRDLERAKNSDYFRVGTDCLCHGTLGNLLCALRIARAMNDLAWERNLRKVADEALGNIVRRGPLTGLGGQIHSKLYPQNPSLMCGLSGIGLGALSLAVENPTDCIMYGRLLGSPT